jgi:hypothetical protein
MPLMLPRSMLRIVAPALTTVAVAVTRPAFAKLSVIGKLSPCLRDCFSRVGTYLRRARSERDCSTHASAADRAVVTLGVWAWLRRLLPKQAINAGAADAEPSCDLGRPQLFPVAELANDCCINLWLPALVHAA